MFNSEIQSYPLFKDYKSHQPQWEKYAAIRSRPRRFLSDEENPGDLYPPSRQPLLAHPLLQNLEEDKRNYILVQSLFYYMNTIVNIEKDIINSVCYKMTKDKYFLKFSSDMKHDALSILIDESYHAYVAIDFMEQVTESTGIAPLPLPEETELSQAIKTISEKLSPEVRENFEFIAVCIAEHALTNDLMVAAKSKNVCKTFFYVMHDHVLDEGRHAKYFSKMLDIFWHFLPEEQKVEIGVFLPSLLEGYFQPDLQKAFDRKILEHIGITTTDIDVILEETHAKLPLSVQKESNIVVAQMIKLLSQTRVVDHADTGAEFKKYGLI